jgi:hypothetical protein
MNAPILEVHPWCVGPEYTQREFRTLCADVLKQGHLLHPIVLLDGKILDGRHRYRACIETGVPVTTCNFDPDNDGDPIAFVCSSLVHRNMTAGQRAAAAVELAAFDEERERAKERQREGGRVGGRAEKVVASRPQAALERESKTRERVGRQAGASGRAVGRTARIRKEGDPALFEAIKDARITPNEAEEYLALPASAQQRIVDEPTREGRRVIAVRAMQRSRSAAYGRKSQKEAAMPKDFARVLLSGLERTLVQLQYEFGLRDADAIVRAFENADMTSTANQNQLERVMPLIDACATISQKSRSPKLRVITNQGVQG